MKFCGLILEFVTKLLSQTDGHFPETVKSCSGHPKTSYLQEAFKEELMINFINHFVSKSDKSVFSKLYQQ